MQMNKSNDFPNELQGGDMLIFIRCIPLEIFSRLKKQLSSDGQEEIGKYRNTDLPIYATDVWKYLHKSDQEEVLRFIRWCRRFKWEWKLLIVGEKSKSEELYK